MNKGAAVRFQLCLAAALLIVAGSVRVARAQESPLDQARREQNTFKILGDADVYCSFFLLGRTRPEIGILAAERGEEKVLLTDADLCYINRGSKNGIAVGQLYLVVEAGPDVIDPVSKANLGAVGLKRGRARVVAVDDDRATVRLEKSCGQVMVGCYLVPFVERQTMVGQDEGYDAPPAEGASASGRVIYLVDTLEEAGTTYWVLINLGTDNGLKVGQQLVAFRRVRGDVPRQPIASLVVIDAGPTTATLKVLSAKDVVQVGTEVQAREVPPAK